MSDNLCICLGEEYELLKGCMNFTNYVPTVIRLKYCKTVPLCGPTKVQIGIICSTVEISIAALTCYHSAGSVYFSMLSTTVCVPVITIS